MSLIVPIHTIIRKVAKEANWGLIVANGDYYKRSS